MDKKPVSGFDQLAFLLETSLAHSTIEILSNWNAQADATPERPKADLLAAWASFIHSRVDLLEAWASTESSVDVLLTWESKHQSRLDVVESWLSLNKIYNSTDVFRHWLARRAPPHEFADSLGWISPIEEWFAARETKLPRGVWIWSGAPSQIESGKKPLPARKLSRKPRAKAE